MINLSENIRGLLDSSIARVRRIFRLRGIAATLAALLFATLVMMAIDAKLTLFSETARWLLSSLVYLVVAAVSYFSIVRPLLARIDRLRVAKILDGRHPEHEEALTTIVELSVEAAVTGRLSCSQTLFEVLSRKAEAAARAIDIEREFTTRTIVRRLKWLGAAIAALTISLVAVPHVAGRLFLRAVAPWVDVGNLYANDIEVVPGDVVALAGEKIRIETRINEGIHFKPQIRISRRGTLGWGEEFVSEMPGGVYETTADLAEKHWRYRISAGPAVTRYYTVRVAELPRTEEFVAVVEHPDYTAWGKVVYSNDDISVVSALAGSRVSFSLKTARGTRAEFLVGNRETFEHLMVSNREVNWSLALTNEEGFKAPERWGTLVSKIDQPPSVLLETPAAKTLKLPPHAKFPLVATASDDVEIVRSQIRFNAGGEGWREYSGELVAAKSGASLWRLAGEIDLSVLPVADTREVSFDIVVDDNCPPEFGGPHSATSQPVIVHIEHSAQNFAAQALAETVAESGKLLAEARNRLADASRKVHEARGQFMRDRKLTRPVEEKIESALHEVSEASKRTEELGDRLAADGRFRPLSDALEEFRKGLLDRSLKQLETAQFASAQERMEALESVEDELNRAAAELKDLEKPFKERVRQLENLERTKDLDARQAALAQAAEEILRERPVDTRKLEVWKRMQQEAARQAEDLRNRTSENAFDEAWRKMEHAAELMDQFKRELENASNQSQSAARREERKEELRREARARRENALKAADDNARRAEHHLREAVKFPSRADHHLRMAENFQRQTGNALEKAMAGEDLDEMFAKSAAELRKALQDEKRSAEDALAAGSRLRRALDAARKAMEEAAIDRQASQPNADAHAKRRREESSRAIAAAAQAQRAAADALSQPTPENCRQAVEAAERAAESMAKALMPDGALAAQEQALDAARELVKQFEREKAVANLKDTARKLDEKAAAAARQAAEAAASSASRQNEAMQAQEAALKAQNSAKFAEEAAAEAESAALDSGEESARRAASEKRAAANVAQKEASALQHKAQGAQNSANKAHEQFVEAERKALAAREAAVNAALEAALADGDELAESAAREAVGTQRDATAAAEARANDRMALQREAAAAQEAAQKAQRDVEAAQAQGDCDLAETRQNEAREAQGAALEAQRQAMNFAGNQLASESASEANPSAAASANSAARANLRQQLAEQTSALERALAQALEGQGDMSEAAAAAEQLQAAAQTMDSEREGALAAAKNPHANSEARPEGSNTQSEANAPSSGSEESSASSKTPSSESSSADGSESGSASGKSDKSGEPSPAKKAAEASAALARETARQMRELGLDAAAQPSSDASGGSSKGEGSGGGLSAEISRKAKELDSGNLPADLKAQFEKSGWFRIRGAAKDGLGERDLSSVPVEYRDLVRKYFLKLADECK